MISRRKFTKEFKQTAVRRLEGGQSLAEVARALEVHPGDLSRWRRELQEHGERAFSGIGKKRAAESRVPELERKIGQQAMEIMQRLNQETGTAFVFTTHDPRVVAFARRVVQMRDGHIDDGGARASVAG